LIPTINPPDAGGVVGVVVGVVALVVGVVGLTVVTGDGGAAGAGAAETVGAETTGEGLRVGAETTGEGLRAGRAVRTGATWRLWVLAVGAVAARRDARAVGQTRTNRWPRRTRTVGRWQTVV
jgi:hypothetical protein